MKHGANMIVVRLASPHRPRNGTFVGKAGGSCCGCGTLLFRRVVASLSSVPNIHSLAVCVRSPARADARPARLGTARKHTRLWSLRPLPRISDGRLARLVCRGCRFVWRSSRSRAALRWEDCRFLDLLQSASYRLPPNPSPSSHHNVEATGRFQVQALARPASRCSHEVGICSTAIIARGDE